MSKILTCVRCQRHFTLRSPSAFRSMCSVCDSGGLIDTVIMDDASEHPALDRLDALLARGEADDATPTPEPTLPMRPSPRGSIYRASNGEMWISDGAQWRRIVSNGGSAP